jgi:alpha-ketoglutarate-dependent 2,4-dichlorophenoxyacetate dioxygenase
VLRRHPGSGRTALYVSAFASYVIGMPAEEGRALVDELITFATQPEFIYRHKWQVGDLVIWDNRMHHARLHAVRSNAPCARRALDDDCRASPRRACR